MIAGLALAALLAPCELHGRVKVVDTPGRADYRVHVTTSPGQADMRVRWVNRPTTRGGEWRRVDEGVQWDFRVYWEPVRARADFVVAFDPVWPGCR